MHIPILSEVVNIVLGTATTVVTTAVNTVGSLVHILVK